ncbi:MAG TPA: LacI family DNA-binding transcriptional regulator [Chiayiivirga sp.]|jgi:DNA-binding LacI/PurR family transcriptional regulator|nr:LacI family DNA-binding transcriptional regulator [Xanthomonadaceae bacterium]MDX9764000.1 LacI family DNA-binding transcriptional regulator [Chiayiivirga sp.]MEB2316780.1 LacI family DNA-binding transcriptional regulator [Xanthomonadaceae bacterium]HRN58768.1 LacI family DNA-binding transcriptional regulator [Chiayiivirga sp.]HRQ34004.1 LacI family DNA-binding transcriptional regulator [Chiayiivirga sp.]
MVQARRSSKKTRVTSLDIAHRAGVSQATVSRVLRGSPLVNADTRCRVEEAVRELNYKVDRHASSLRTQRAGTLALLLFEDPTADDSHINPFFLAMLGSITRACARHGHDLLVSFQQLSDDWHADYDDSMKADGLILLGYGDYLAYESTLAQLVAQGTHFVRWGHVWPDQPGVTIGCDNANGGRLAGRHLLQLGRRRIAFLGNASDGFPEFQARHRGCAQALAEAGLGLAAELQVNADSTEQAGYEAARALLAHGRSFDAVFAASDLIAIGAMRALQDAGLRVPADVAVVGFDGTPMARFCNPPLTTVVQDTTTAGELLVQALLAQVRGEDAVSLMLQPTLDVRASSIA